MSFIFCGFCQYVNSGESLINLTLKFRGLVNFWGIHWGFTHRTKPKQMRFILILQTFKDCIRLKLIRPVISVKVRLPWFDTEEYFKKEIRAWLQIHILHDLAYIQNNDASDTCWETFVCVVYRLVYWVKFSADDILKYFCLIFPRK